MNWDALGAIAELVGAIAVILTLIYLAVQIKQSGKLVEQNTQMLNVSQANATREAMNEVSRIIAADGEAGRLYWNGLEDRNALSEEDAQRFDSMQYLLFSSAQQGLQTDSDVPLTSLRWALERKGTRDWWAEYKPVFKEDMHQVVDALIAEIQGTTEQRQK
jgi:hypothetical protein